MPEYFCDPGLPRPVRIEEALRNNERCTPKTIGQNFRGIVCRCDKHKYTYTVKPDGYLTTLIVAKGKSND